MTSPSPKAELSSNNTLAENLALLKQSAASVHRVPPLAAREDPTRTICHKGDRIHLLSQEDGNRSLVSQELIFFGYAVLFERGEPLKTGRLSGPLEGGEPVSDRVQTEAVPSERTLDYASHLLKAVPSRDFYAQHLLKHINDALAQQGYDDSRTLISDVTRYASKAPSPNEATQRIETASTARSHRTLPLVLALIAFISAAAVAAYVLLT